MPATLECDLWNRADDLGYVDGLDDYEFVADSPINSTDWTGLRGSPGGGTAKWAQGFLAEHGRDPIVGLDYGSHGKPGIIIGTKLGRGKFSVDFAPVSTTDLHRSYMQIKFIPDDIVKKDCLADKITFIQFVKDGDTGGWVVDESNPYPYYIFTRTVWTPTGVPKAAQMDDVPGDLGHWYKGGYKTNYSQEFVTIAFVEAGKEKGYSYGSVRWGHSFDFSTSPGKVTRWVGNLGSWTGDVTDPAIGTTGFQEVAPQP